MEIGMATLQVKDFPDDLYEKLRLMAEQEKRSISQQTTLIIEKALEDQFSIKRIKLYQEIDELAKMVSFEDPTERIRNDRDS